MRSILKFVPTIFTLLICHHVHARIGLADWTSVTPGKNEINNFNNLTLYLQNGKQLEGLNNWFFYKNNIIGQLHNKKYFVVNETTFHIDTFQTEDEWLKFRRTNNINPKLWTRWFDTNWKTTFGDFAFYILVSFYISIPAMILFLWLCYKAIRQEKFSMRNRYTIIVASILSIVLINFLLGQFPQSI